MENRTSTEVRTLSFLLFTDFYKKIGHLGGRQTKETSEKGRRGKKKVKNHRSKSKKYKLHSLWANYW